MERYECLGQTIPVSEARQKLGQLVNEVYRQRVRVIVEKSGIPVAAIVSVTDLERWLRLEQTRKEDYMVVPEIGDAFRDVPDEDLVEEIAKAVRMARMEMKTRQDEKDTIVKRIPTSEELARRQAVVAKILAAAKERVISPVTSADLVHGVREERKEAMQSRSSCPLASRPSQVAK